MKRIARGMVLFACAGAFSARTQSSATPQQAAGLESDWEIAALLQEIAAHAAGIGPLLDRADARQWIAKGAPEAYAAQLQSSKNEARSLAESAKAVAANPEKLSAEMQIVFQEQGLETLLGSVVDAMRKYQNPASAQELLAAAAAWGVDRDRLEQYVVNLAAQREKEYQVMDQETQRCRAAMLAPASTSAKKK
jgi:hypothetical protein